MSQYGRLQLAVTLIFIILLTSCVSLQYSSNVEASDYDIETVVEGNTEFAIDLHKKLKTAEGNLFFSPYSISTALAMTYGGARNETAKQMAATLHFSLKSETLHSAFADMQSKLNSMQRKKEIQLNIANSLWPQDKYPFLKEYLKLAKKYYRTEITPLDYKTNSEDARKKINAWVEEKTNNKIKNIISTPPDPLTRLILVNAIYFKGDWASQFKKSATTEMPFYLNENKSIEVPMMHQISEFNYGEDESLQFLELPYAGNKLLMLIILPKKIDGLQNREEILTKESLEGWTRNLSKRNVAVYLPRFKMTSEFRLDKELESMGMQDAFDMDKANFSGMDGNPNWLYIGAVLHKAFIDVNEEGTEAAAATGVIMRVKSAPEYVIFRADHPFLFLIQDNLTGSILFMGRVSNPSME
jgi:serpin B